MMRRHVDKELKKWKQHVDRLPLVIRGARQIGKSFSVEAFGRRDFDNIVVADFEKNPEICQCFTEKDPTIICKKISYRLGVNIVPHQTLLFLDEIQLCPEAITSLRYFKESMPELHVIAAGSLLEFILDDEEFSFPVGRMEFLNMMPLSFVEYLEAVGQGQLIELIETASLENPLDTFLHELLQNHVRDYFLVGGMPAVVNLYCKTNSYLEVLRRQKALLNVYQLDFAKYADKIQHHYLKRLFERAPEMVAKHFKFSKVDPEAPNPARDYKIALGKLQQANLLHLVHATAANGLPLRAEKEEKKFKILFLDVGLLQCALGVDAKSFQQNSLMAINRGCLAEQYVGQELLAYRDFYLDRQLYFWENQEKTSSAEIDLVMNLSGNIVPIEVKAGAGGHLKSLKQFLERKKVPLGVRIYDGNLTYADKILSIPFYLISQIERLISFSN